MSFKEMLFRNLYGIDRTDFLSPECKAAEGRRIHDESIACINKANYEDLLNANADEGSGYYDWEEATRKLIANNPDNAGYKQWNKDQADEEKHLDSYWGIDFDLPI